MEKVAVDDEDRPVQEISIKGGGSTAVGWSWSLSVPTCCCELACVAVGWAGPIFGQGIARVLLARVLCTLPHRGCCLTSPAAASAGVTVFSNPFREMAEEEERQAEQQLQQQQDEEDKAGRAEVSGGWDFGSVLGTACMRGCTRCTCACMC